MSREDAKYGVWRDNFAKIADKSDKRISCNILQFNFYKIYYRHLNQVLRR